MIIMIISIITSIAVIVVPLFILIIIFMLCIMTKVNSLYGDVSRDGLWATGVLLLGAGGDGDKHQLVISVISLF